jgi:serine protease
MLRNFLRPAVRLGGVLVRHMAHTTGRCLRLAPLMVVALGCLPITSHAVDQVQSIEVLLSNAPGAPTPDQVVNYFGTSPRKAGGPPLQGLTVENPQKTYYLMQPRASGDFLAYLQANPNSARAQLERYVIVVYLPTANLANALSALRADPNVASAFTAEHATFSSVQLSGFTIEPNTPAPLTSGAQYGRDDLNVDAAWQLAGGYALVGDIDSGLYMNHPALQQFSTSGQYVGGNFIPVASTNVGGIGEDIRYPTAPIPAIPQDGNVDEELPYPEVLKPNTLCNPQNGFAQPPPAYAGHGTHVSGLIAANSDNSLGLKGTCKHCGIAQWKITFPYCVPPIQSIPNDNAIPVAITSLAQTGAQVINMSFGTPHSTAADFCTSSPTAAYCLALKEATYRGVAMVASSGNDRRFLNFPASDSRVISAGGFDGNLALWDESPNSTTYCPLSPFTTDDGVYLATPECGSNYTTVAGAAKQELMAASKAVLSTTYPNLNWNPALQCGDQFPGPGFGNGQGLCTGTSMSAPQISGVVGLLRSINPLVLPSKPVIGFGEVPGIRTVLAQTTVQAQANQAWTSTFGYGRPDAAAAARTLLGKVAGRVVKNRVTPLFRMYSAGATDYADTASPQVAVALNIYSVASYAPQGAAIPGYPSFPPNEPGASALPAPKAAAYVLTTEYTPWPNYPPLLPLYMVDRSRYWPLGCIKDAPGCNVLHRDFTLMTKTADIEQAHTDGYNLRTIQGYIYQQCSPEPQCIPPAAQKFYRECNTAIDDCATFLESERATFEANGYTTAYPASSSKVLGYAYSSQDSDGDGLVDGFEYVIGTNPNLADSNGDGTPDGVEFPMAGVPVSDPCLGVGAFNCPADRIFKNGFQ